MNGCRMREMFSDMPFKYGIVAVVVRVALSLASVVVVVVVVVVVGRPVSVSSDEIFVIIVLGKNTVKVLVPFR